MGEEQRSRTRDNWATQSQKIPGNVARTSTDSRDTIHRRGNRSGSAVLRPVPLEFSPGSWRKRSRRRRRWVELERSKQRAIRTGEILENHGSADQQLDAHSGRDMRPVFQITAPRMWTGGCSNWDEFRHSSGSGRVSESAIRLRRRLLRRLRLARHNRHNQADDSHCRWQNRPYIPRRQESFRLVAGFTHNI